MPNLKNVSFGKCFSDHMLEIEWSEDKGWSKPIISPTHDLLFHPATKVFHYAQEVRFMITVYLYKFKYVNKYF